jgi:uncharacterized protein YjbJ (UPF0337 family)
VGVRRKTQQTTMLQLFQPSRYGTQFGLVRCFIKVGAPQRSVLTTPQQSRWSKVMNWDRIEGDWKQMKGKAKEKWGQLTDDDMDVIAGKRDQLAGKIQSRYGIAKDEAEKQIDDWAKAHETTL